MQKAIVHDFFFIHSPATVWAHLIKSDLLAQWLLGNDFKLEIGHRGFSWLKNYLPYLIMNKGWLKIGNRLVDKVAVASVGANKQIIHI